MVSGGMRRIRKDASGSLTARLIFFYFKSFLPVRHSGHRTHDAPGGSTESSEALSLPGFEMIPSHSSCRLRES